MQVGIPTGRTFPLQRSSESPSFEPGKADQGRKLVEYYEAMSQALGPMHWWPAESPFEVIVGAILTQNTAWTNVERAISNLKRERLLNIRSMERVSVRRLGKAVRSSGYFRQKAKKLKAFVRFLKGEYGGSLKRMFATPTVLLRQQLLAIHGIGPETADSILLYAGLHRIFVVDAYTRRILARHGHSNGKEDYDEIRAMFEDRLPQDTKIYNEYHALIVNTGKKWCRTKKPLCSECPLGKFLPAGAIHSIEANP